MEGMTPLEALHAASFKLSTVLPRSRGGLKLLQSIRSGDHERAQDAVLAAAAAMHRAGSCSPLAGATLLQQQEEAAEQCGTSELGGSATDMLQLPRRSSLFCLFFGALTCCGLCRDRVFLNAFQKQRFTNNPVQMHPAALQARPVWL